MKSFSNLIRDSYRFAVLLCCVSAALVVQGCKSDRENAFLDLTTMEIEDPVRHYYPIVRGLEQNIVVKVTNTGKNPLKIYKVLPSCGCTIAKFSTKAVAPGNDAFIQLKYDSTKNVGKVGVYTTILANTKEHSHTMYFDINVVPDALYTKDYEELYHIKLEEEGLTQELVEGKTNQRGYIIDSTNVQKYK
ncbi:DUF1573 domain-containing protein [Flavobacterium litorale]|uniref:DUF1573 domain-containing protein n=1 Tax=Flavobacterium litorale TaxID=2856519 RepID=A0ABX8V5A8_9FLAO|nr:DUF1573 domain-containing protein [Flavobacterium litorale]QYJ68011.1 DUF1573 domain-containing protein [Flavobacterium litorale]